MALSQSLPTPTTQELFAVVVREAEGAPLPLADPTAPTAPDPLTPLEFAPENVMTVIEDSAEKARVAVTETFERSEGAKARQISDVPRWRFSRTTKTHVKLAPLTEVMELFVPVELCTSVEKKAKSNSFGAVVEKMGLEIEVEAVPWSCQTTASAAIEVKLVDWAEKLMPERPVPESVTDWL